MSHTPCFSRPAAAAETTIHLSDVITGLSRALDITEGHHKGTRRAPA